uniref:Uncharacterized protein n=1 Tax=Anguilla anguilla TaxID=7936 RepID=A0A0E9WQ97_ANGAN
MFLSLNDNIYIFQVLCSQVSWCYIDTCIINTENCQKSPLLTKNKITNHLYFNTLNIQIRELFCLHEDMQVYLHTHSVCNVCVCVYVHMCSE